MNVNLARPRRRIRSSPSDIVFNVVVYAICILVLIVIVYPLYFVVIASFSDPDAIVRGEVILLPKHTSLDAYREVFKNTQVWRGYYNTIIYTVGNTLISLFCTITAAYALSRRDFRLRMPLMIYFLIAMFFNGGMIPTYIQIMRMGLLDTYWVMVLPTAVSVYNLIIARTFFAQSIPDELREAAQIDGCTNLRFFIRIVLPLSKAILAVIGLYVAVASWNSYMNALIYLQSQDMKPLQLVLRGILLQNERAQDAAIEALRKAEMLKYALIIVSTLPIMCVYPFIQKHFAQGVMIGSVKG